ncbi:hypothetical protein UQ81_14530, partial [Shigella dysenteriae]
MAEKKRTRWQRRPGMTGGKLPWNDWRNATTWRKATQLLLLAMNIYIAITGNDSNLLIVFYVQIMPDD